MAIIGEVNNNIVVDIKKKFNFIDETILGMYKGSFKKFSNNDFIIITNKGIIFVVKDDFSKKYTPLNYSDIIGMKKLPGSYYGKIQLIDKNREYEFSEINMIVFNELVELIEKYYNHKEENKNSQINMNDDLLNKPNHKEENKNSQINMNDDLLNKLKQKLVDGEITIKEFDEKTNRIITFMNGFPSEVEEKICPSCTTSMKLSNTKYCIECGISL